MKKLIIALFIIGSTLFGSWEKWKDNSELRNPMMESSNKAARSLFVVGETENDIHFFVLFPVKIGSSKEKGTVTFQVDKNKIFSLKGELSSNLASINRGENKSFDQLISQMKNGKFITVTVKHQQYGENKM